LVLAWLGISLLWFSVAWGALTPTQAVKETIDQVLLVLGDEALKDSARKDERREKLEAIIKQRFDYEEMAKRTLGAKWKKISTEKQKEFVELFQQFLTQAYAGNVDGYSGEQVEYLKERLKGDFAEVQTKVVSSKVQIPLDYRLLKKNDKWGVYDVIIDGVSLTKNYRGQFSRIIKSSSFEALLDKLRSKADLAASS
jgi:phospholipid transport system substrate-binding protein